MAHLVDPTLLHRRHFGPVFFFLLLDSAECYDHYIHTANASRIDFGWPSLLFQYSARGLNRRPNKTSFNVVERLFCRSFSFLRVVDVQLVGIHPRSFRLIKVQPTAVYPAREDWRRAAQRIWRNMVSMTTDTLQGTESAPETKDWRQRTRPSIDFLLVFGAAFSLPSSG